MVPALIVRAIINSAKNAAVDAARAARPTTDAEYANHLVGVWRFKDIEDGRVLEVEMRHQSDGALQIAVSEEGAFGRGKQAHGTWRVQGGRLRYTITKSETGQIKIGENPPLRISSVSAKSCTLEGPEVGEIVWTRAN